MMITATKVKAIHIPYPTPAPPHTHTRTCPPPLYLTLSLWWISAPRSNSTSTMEDAHKQRPREGPCTHSTPHRQTRLDSPPPPHTHRL